MKHTFEIVITLLLLFFLSQVVGLYIIYENVDTEQTLSTGEIVWKPLVFGERPEVEANFSYVPIVIAIAVGTIFALLLVKFGWYFIWRLWFFLAIWYAVSIAVFPFVTYSIIAVMLGLTLALYKLYGKSIILKNFAEIFIYAGIAVILVPVLNILSASILLVLISIYDAWAVWKSGHMIVLAKAQSKLKVFAGLQIPYQMTEKVSVSQKPVAKKLKPEPLPHKKMKIKITNKLAILGGGDIAFSLLFAGAIMKDFGFHKALVIPVFTTLALFALLSLGKKNKFYPAMPFLTTGCFLGYFVVLIL
ncbi:hypothetical protein KY311_00245 [Candidatus Woesearchaeota archaeon]|nr:hypothetical protein [Candidatus Woesearchaeota archaeon]MBW3017178.1 hypothetical protein [Candidatus Woesearchaeota archaeon]